MKNRIWPVVFSLVFLASCQSSRFMQDDMYFTVIDAKREVRQFEVTQLEKQNASLKKDLGVENYQPSNPSTINIDDYYDYCYSSRIRRFNDPDNSWAYYDPYYTNYYWFNQSNSQYFGNSVYSTYSWWGPNFGNNYNSDYWANDKYQGSASKKGWSNPWKNNVKKNGWSNPSDPYVYNGWNSPLNNNSISWNNNFCFNNMYYNSLDNNCYWWWWKKGDAPASKGTTNFVALMQSNGISKDVVQRPDIDYTAIKESYNLTVSNTTDTIDSNKINNSMYENTVTDNSKNTNNNKGTVVNSTNNNTKNNTTNTSKRWDNYNADVNISPNNNTNNNWSRSGVFSEGSRNNNYEFKGSAIPSNKNSTDQHKEKDLKR